MANNFMLMTLFSLIADTAEDPDGFRTDVKNALFDLADHHTLPGVAPGIAKEARDAAKLVGHSPKPETIKAELIGVTRTARRVINMVIRSFPVVDGGVSTRFSGKP